MSCFGHGNCTPNLAPFAASDLIEHMGSPSGARMSGSVQMLAQAVAEILGVGDCRPMVTQYAAPSSAGFAVGVEPGAVGGSVALLLRPTGTMATGALLLPHVSQSRDGQEVVVWTAESVTALTVNGNGAAVSGAPSTLVVGGYFRLRFDLVHATWIRIG